MSEDTDNGSGRRTGLTASERSRRRYQKRIQNRLCTVCGTQDYRTLSGLTRCEACEKQHLLEKQKAREIEKDSRERWLVSGRCVQCGKLDRSVMDGDLLCLVCIAKHNRAEKEKRIQKRKQELEKLRQTSQT